jgi:hypothetical protein
LLFVTVHGFMLNPASLLRRISPVIANPVSMAALQSRFLKTLLFLRATYPMREISLSQDVTVAADPGFCWDENEILG